MYRTALLLLTGQLRAVVESISLYLNSAKKNVGNCLYIKLEPELSNPFSKADSLNLSRLSSAMPIVYSKASQHKDVDVRLILTNLNKSESKFGNSLHLDVVLTNSDADESSIQSYVGVNFGYQCSNIIKLDKLVCDSIVDESPSEFHVFNTVCLGGTFDRLHDGHKVLLSEAVLRAKERLIVGVSEGSMIKKKVLWELIEPIEKRMEEVKKFLTDVDPTLRYEVVPITDPYGPTITNSDIDCLLVTTETKIGGDKVNLERKKRDMKELTMFVVNLVENSEHSSEEDEKLSSSTQRIHLLGALLKSPQSLPQDNQPYCILLQGYPVNDKSCIASGFQTLGIPVLCCDEILFSILNKDKDLSNSYAEEFPDYSMLTGSSVHMGKLIAACLKNKKIKEWLAEKVYLKMRSALHQVLEVYTIQGANIIIVKDSTLFEGHDLNINFQEIWATILPVFEFIKKLREDFDCSEDEANDMRKYLPSNEEYMDVANRVFCNMWSADATNKQINRACCDLGTLK